MRYVTLLMMSCICFHQLIGTNPTLALCMLSWKDPQTLLQTLKSYDDNGLLAYANQKIIFFNEISAEDVQIAQKYNFKIIGDAQNRGIAHAFNVLANTATADLFLFLEDDWTLIENQHEMKLQLDAAKKLLMECIVDVVRLRHRRNPGYPLYTSWFKNHELEKGFAHLLDCIHWIEHPEEKFPAYIQKLSNGPLLYITTAKNGNHTNNPSIYRREWLLETIIPKLILGTQQPHDLEKELITWWSQQNFIIAQGNGLFTHSRPYKRIL